MANIKEKLLNFGQFYGLNKSEMAHRLNISKSNFVGDSMRSEVGSKILERFCKEFPTVLAEWLLRDTEPMIIGSDAQLSETNINNGVNIGHIGSSEHQDEAQNIPTPTCDACALLNAKEQVIRAQQTTILAQQRTIELLIKQ